MEDYNHPMYNFVNADSQLDPEGEDLPWNHIIELCTMTTHSHRLREATPERDVLANELAAHIPPPELPESNPGNGEGPTIFKALSTCPKLQKHVEEATDFLNKVKWGYRKDTLFSKVLEDKEKYSLFWYGEGFLYTENRGGQEVLRIPRVVTKDYSLTATVIKKAHTILGHYGAQKTADYIRWWYWWPKLGHKVNKYCTMCGICQVNKTSMQWHVGILHTLVHSLNWKDSITYG